MALDELSKDKNNQSYYNNLGELHNKLRFYVNPPNAYYDQIKFRQVTLVPTDASYMNFNIYAGSNLIPGGVTNEMLNQDAGRSLGTLNRQLFVYNNFEILKDAINAGIDMPNM